MPRATIVSPVRPSDEQLVAQHDLELKRRATDRPIPEPPISRARHDASWPDEGDLSPTLDLAEDLATVLRGVSPKDRKLYVVEPEADYQVGDDQDDEWRLDAGMPPADDYGDEAWP